VAAGGAVIKAAQSLRQKIARIAAFLLNIDVERVELVESKAIDRENPENSVDFRQVAQTAYSMTSVALPQGESFGLEVVDTYDPPLATWPNAVHAVMVAVDRRTAKVSIEKYVVVHDSGRLINPMIVDGQIHGGIAQGIGEALMEQIVYDEDGQMLNANLLDYLMPMALDVPNIDIIHIETPSIDSLGGFKGVGEGGVIGAVPAVTNAVADALAKTGANINRIPLRPSYLLREMHRQSAAAAGDRR
jgi:aerobic carbon-monoxide dehydrogenase large subunit